VSATDETRRLTPTERLHEVTMATLQRAGSPPEHSAEITRNARGIVQFSVTVRGYDLDDVLSDAVTAAGVLDVRYPYPDANGGTAE
jgi:hypothetical protein